MRRATVMDIRKYDWFKKDLHKYLFPDEGSLNADIIDEEALAEVSGHRGHS